MAEQGAQSLQRIADDRNLNRLNLNVVAEMTTTADRKYYGKVDTLESRQLREAESIAMKNFREATGEDGAGWWT